MLILFIHRNDIKEYSSDSMLSSALQHHIHTVHTRENEQNSSDVSPKAEEVSSRGSVSPRESVPHLSLLLACPELSPPCAAPRPPTRHHGELIRRRLLRFTPTRHAVT